MTGTSANVRAASGSIWTAALATTAPTNPTSAFATGWAQLGAVGADGIKQAFNVSTEDRRDADGNLLRRVISSSEMTFAFRIEERNTAVWSLWYPGSTQVVTTGVAALTVKTPTRDVREFGFQLDDGTVHTRIIVPRGEITNRGDVAFKTEGYDFTMTAYPDSANTIALIYTDDPAVVGP